MAPPPVYPSKPLSRATLTTVGFAVFMAGGAAGGAWWASAVESQVRQISTSVERIETQIDKLADFNTRIAVIEAAIVRMDRDEREEP